MSERADLQSQNYTNRLAFGANGFADLENGSEANAADRFVVIEAEGDTVFSFDNDVPKGIKSSTAYLLKDGSVRYGYFSNIVVASGKLIAYHAN